MKIKPLALKILFFVWSFGPFLVAARNIRDRKYHGIILLFSVVYGYSVYMYSGDVVRYADSFALMARADWRDYWDLLAGAFTGGNFKMLRYGLTASQPDIYALSLQFLVSRVTEESRWFFALVSLVYTWFFLKFVDEAAREIPWIGSFAQKVFFVFLLLVVPFYVGVTGVRFWTALFLFMVCAIRYVRDRHIKHIFLAALCPLIHFTFIVPVGLLLVYRLVNLSRLITYAVVLASIGFFVVTSNSQILNYIESSSGFFSGTKVADRLEGYGNEDIQAERQGVAATTNWYVQLKAKLLIYVLLLLTMIEMFGGIRYKNNEFLQDLQPMFLLFFVLAMFTFNLGSIGRFQYVFYLFGLLRYTILAGINPRHTPLKLISLGMVPVLVLHVLVSFRAGFYTVDPLLLVGNPYVLFMYQSDLSLSQLIVGH